MRVIEPQFDSASSHIPEEWSAIDWRKVQENVRVMQHRLAKATLAGNWRRVKSLQRWLTHSFSAKALAVKPRDKAVNELNRQLYRELASFMVESPSTIGRALSLMTVSKRLERIADHATNIAEEVVYLYEAKDIRHAGQKPDEA